MRPDVDRMLTDHVERTPGATMSSTVNAALVDYLEAAALAAYHQWDLEADAEERSALAAFDAHNDDAWSDDARSDDASSDDASDEPRAAG